MADDATKKDDTPTILATAPVLPLRDIVVFPHMIVPLFEGREKSVRALEEVMNDEKQILLLTQKNAAEDDPTAEGLHTIGTLATVLQLLKLPDQTVRVLVEGKARARGHRLLAAQRFLPGHHRAHPRDRGCAQGSRGADAHGEGQFRAVHQAQQEDPVRDAGPPCSRSTMRPSWPIPSLRICRSRSATARRCWKPFRPPSGWRRFSR